MRKLLVAGLGTLALAGLILAAAALPLGADEEQPAAATEQTTAQTAYEEANALMIVRGLGLAGDQLQLLATFLQTTGQQRQAYRAQITALWARQAPAIHAALPAWLSYAAPPANAGDAEGALRLAYQSAAGLDRTYDNAIGQWIAGLLPTQAALLESPAQAASRQANQGLLGGVTDPATYLADVADALRSLDSRAYEAVKYWEAARLVALLGPSVPIADPATAARQLVTMYDQIYAINNVAYNAQRAGLPAAITQNLGLPAAGTTTRAPYDLDDLRLLFSSDAALARVQGLVNPKAAPVPPVDEPTQTALEEMGKAVAQWRAYSLLAALQMTPGQIQAIQPLVAQAGARRKTLEAAEASTQAQAGSELADLAAALGAATAMLPEAPQRWGPVVMRLRSLRQTAAQDMTGLLARIPQYLSLAQASQTNWPAAPAGVQGQGAGQGQAQSATLEELREVAARLAGGRNFLESLRRVPANMYVRLRIGRTRDFIAQYLPAGSAEAQDAQTWVLDVVSQSKRTSDLDWNQVAPAMVTDMMIRLGAVPVAVPGAGGNKPLAWSDVYDILTDPAAPDAVAALVQARPGG